jgi:hypothetical protein
MKQFETTKNVKGFLIYNWRNNRLRASKKIPKNLGVYDVVMRIDVTVNIPKLTIVEMKTEYTIPESQVKTAIIEGLCDGDYKKLTTP